MGDVHLAKAWQLLSDRDNDAARAEFTKAVATNPEDIEALIGLGKTLARMGQVNDALQAFEKALQLDPNSAEAHYGAGWAHFRMKEWQEAEMHDQKAVNLAPDVAKYHIAAAACAQKRGDLETVLVHLEAANRANPLELDRQARWALVYSRIFAGVEKLGLLVGWATLVTICSCNLSAASLRWRLLIASLPFLVASGWNLKKGYYRRAIWSLVLCLLWAVSTYVLIGWIVNR